MSELAGRPQHSPRAAGAGAPGRCGVSRAGATPVSARTGLGLSSNARSRIGRLSVPPDDGAALRTRGTSSTPDNQEDLRRDLISSRLSSSELERRILEVVSVSGRLAERSLVLEAAGSANADGLVQRLESARLVRTSSIDGRRCVEIYHDRIREAAIARFHPRSPSVTASCGGARGERRGGCRGTCYHFLGAGELLEAATTSWRQRSARSMRSSSRAGRSYTTRHGIGAHGTARKRATS